MSIQIAILGFGTVAKGLPPLLQDNHEKIRQLAGDDLSISHVLVRREEDGLRLTKEGHPYHFVTDLQEILDQQDISIVVELMGRIEPAYTYIRRAIEAGKHVVTANKDLLAIHGNELAQLAEKHDVHLLYEAAVAGGIPILRTLSESLAGDRLTRILGILNGTTNFMLTKMSDEGWTYDQALKEAQRLGYAESDPTNDVEGIDAAYKALILTRFGFGVDLDFNHISHRGISSLTPVDVAVAQKMGYVVKLLADIQETTSGISVDVSPAFIPHQHPLANVHGVMNAVYVESTGLGHSMYYGPGAGQLPTATSVLTDLIQVAKANRSGRAPQPFVTYQTTMPLAKAEDVMSSYYVSLEMSDQSGKMLELADCFQKAGISFKQIAQEESDGRLAHVVVITHQMSQKQLSEVLSAIETTNDIHTRYFCKVLGDIS